MALQTTEEFARQIRGALGNFNDDRRPVVECVTRVAEQLAERHQQKKAMVLRIDPRASLLAERRQEIEELIANKEGSK